MQQIGGKKHAFSQTSQKNFKLWTIYWNGVTLRKLDLQNFETSKFWKYQRISQFGKINSTNII